jgi:hypothetical protein
LLSPFEHKSSFRSSAQAGLWGAKNSAAPNSSIEALTDLKDCRNAAALARPTGREQSTASGFFGARRAGFNISIFPIRN